MEQNNNIHYKEADIIDYLRIAVKRKRQLFVFIIIGGIIGLYMSFNISKINKGQTIIEIGIENYFVTVIKIQNGLYGNFSGVKTTNLENTNLIKIEISSKQSQEEIKKSLLKLNENILSKHNEILENQKNILDKRIKDIEKIIFLQKSDGKETENARLTIFGLEGTKDNLTQTKIIQEPVVFPKNNNTGIMLINFIFGTMAGAVFFLLCASFLEWWRKNWQAIR